MPVNNTPQAELDKVYQMIKFTSSQTPSESHAHLDIPFKGVCRFQVITGNQKQLTNSATISLLAFSFSPLHFAWEKTISIVLLSHFIPLCSEAQWLEYVGLKHQNNTSTEKHVFWAPFLEYFPLMGFSNGKITDSNTRRVKVASCRSARDAKCKYPRQIHGHSLRIHK